MINKIIFSKRFVTLILAGIVILIGGQSYAQTSPTPFPCDEKLYISNNISLYEYSYTGDDTWLFDIGDVNALGYSPVTGIMWAYDKDTHRVIRIGANSVIEQVTIPDLPIPAGNGVQYNVGGIDEYGYFYLYNGQAGARFYIIDTDPARPDTYEKLVDPGANGGVVPYALDTRATKGTPITSNNRRYFSDWCINPADGRLYTITNNVSGNSASQQLRLISYDPLSGNLETHSGKITGDGILNNDSFGAIFIDLSGKFYAFGNQAGHLYLIDPTNNSATRISSNTISSNNIDGANCILYNPPNYWHGTIDTDWSKDDNWTKGYVPADYEDIEFATEANNRGDAAERDLYLDKDRIIGDLINKSETEKNLVVTTGNELRITGKVWEDNTGIIVVKADPYNARTNGTLILNPDIEANKSVQAIVEFHNKAYECDNCGFYRKQWQYFGIPVQQTVFPATGNEIVNQWSEPTNGNKWITPASPLQAFKGYEITNTATSTIPTHIYEFEGTLNVGNTTVALTKTSQVNYSGANLLGNSYTAAIPIATALSFSTGVADRAVYLFNTGTRDQWRNLNGSVVPGVSGGQYISVPFELAGQQGLPEVIPSMHSFMIFADPATTVTIDYEKLEKNQLVKDAEGNDIATRSASSGQEKEDLIAVQQLPALVMDAIGKTSADRIWIFGKSGTTHGFDSGWDGRKMEEEGITQLYVSGSDSSKLQVATVPDMNNVGIGFVPDSDGRYTLEFSFSGQLKTAEIHLYDKVTKAKKRIRDGGSFSFDAKKGETPNRFCLTYGTPLSQLSPDEELIEVTATTDGKIKIVNRGSNDCSAFISGKEVPLQRREVKAGGEETIENLTKGTYIVRLQNAEVTDARRVTIK